MGSKMIADDGLNGFMLCDRTFNSVCLHEQDYEDVVLALAKNDAEQNIIYQELHLDYPLNEERGIPMEVVMEGYRSAQKKAKELYGVEIVYIGGIDRTLSSISVLNLSRNWKNIMTWLQVLAWTVKKKDIHVLNIWIVIWKQNVRDFF